MPKRETKNLTDVDVILASIIQSLQKNETITAGERDFKIAKVNELLNLLSPGEKRQAEILYRQKIYKNVSYAQIPTLNENPEVASILTLDGADLKVYSLIERMMISQYFSLKITDIMEVLHLSKGAASQALKSLREKKIIELIVKPTNREPAIYRVNTAVARYGAIKQPEKKDLQSLGRSCDNEFEEKERLKNQTTEEVLQEIKTYSHTFYIGLDKAFLEDDKVIIYAKIKDAQIRENKH